MWLYLVYNKKQSYSFVVILCEWGAECEVCLRSDLLCTNIWTLCQIHMFFFLSLVPLLLKVLIKFTSLIRRFLKLCDLERIKKHVSLIHIYPPPNYANPNIPIVQFFLVQEVTLPNVPE